MEIVTHMAAAVFGAALLQVYFVWRDTRSARLPSVRSRELPPATTARVERPALAFHDIPPSIDQFDDGETEDFEPPGAA